MARSMYYTLYHENGYSEKPVTVNDIKILTLYICIDKRIDKVHFRKKLHQYHHVKKVR